MYIETLKNSGFKGEFTYLESKVPGQPKKRNEKAEWINNIRGLEWHEEGPKAEIHFELLKKTLKKVSN